MGSSQTGLDRALRLYYVATFLFLLLDVGLGINVRITFLADSDGLRLLYYVACFGCLAVIIARPARTVPVAAVESLITMVLLILSTGTRVMHPDAAAGALTIEQLVNFLVSGFAAYLAWTRSMAALFGGR